jgi:hypothetical protein
MVNVGVALAWVAISGVSLKWLSAFGQRSTSQFCEPEIPHRDGELLPEELYPLELTTFSVGGSR